MLIAIGVLGSQALWEEKLEWIRIRVEKIRQYLYMYRYTLRHRCSFIYTHTFTYSHLYGAYLNLLWFEDTVFLQTEGLRQSCITQVYWDCFSNICSLHVFVSHFSNSHSSSNFFIIITLVRLICDQWSLMFLLQKHYNSLKAQLMLSIFLNNNVTLGYVHCFLDVTSLHTEQTTQ